jgi:hypothetical protein
MQSTRPKKTVGEQMNQTNNTKTVGVRISQEAYDKLTQIANTDRRTYSKTIELLILQYKEEKK